MKKSGGGTSKDIRLGNQTFFNASYLADSSQGAVGSIRTVLIRESPAPKAVHGVGGDGVAELLEGVIPVPALFDLVEQFGQLTCHSIICGKQTEVDLYFL